MRHFDQTSEFLLTPSFRFCIIPQTKNLEKTSEFDQTALEKKLRGFECSAKWKTLSCRTSRVWSKYLRV